MLKIGAVTLLLFSFLSDVNASTEFFTDYTECALVEVGHLSKSNPVILEGHRWGVANVASGCTVSIPRREFEKRYSICFLTGVNVQKTGSCSFGLRKGDGEENYIFEFDDQETIECRFTCIGEGV